MTIETINKQIAEESAVMLYFSGNDCGVCEVLKPKIKESFDINFPDINQIFIEADKYKEIASHFGVFSVPTVLVFLEGKEFSRKSRNISVPMFIEELKRPYQIMRS